MRRGDRLIRLSTLELGDFAHVEDDGWIAVWFDDRTGDPAPIIVHPHDLECAEVRL